MYGYGDFYKVGLGWELVESVNSLRVEALIEELTYEDNKLTIRIDGGKVITLSNGSVAQLKQYFYWFLRGMEEMWVVIRDTFNL